MRWARHVAHKLKMRNSYILTVEKIWGEGITWGGGARRNRNDKIKVHLEEIVCEDVDRNELAQERIKWQAFVNYGNESSGSIKAGGFLDQLSEYLFLKKICSGLMWSGC
jgi:hypothetical protein